MHRVGPEPLVEIARRHALNHQPALRQQVCQLVLRVLGHQRLRDHTLLIGQRRLDRMEAEDQRRAINDWHLTRRLQTWRMPAARWPSPTGPTMWGIAVVLLRHCLRDPEFLSAGTKAEPASQVKFPQPTPLRRPTIPVTRTPVRSLRLSVRTPDFQFGKTGSTPVGCAICVQNCEHPGSGRRLP